MRALLLMLVMMIMNLSAVLVYSILMFVVGEYETGAPVSKRALAAATHAIQGSQTVQLGGSGSGVVIPRDFTGKFPDLEAPASLFGDHQAFAIHQVLRRTQDDIGFQERSYYRVTTPS